MIGISIAYLTSLRTHSPGDTITVTVLRERQELLVEATLTERPV